MRMVERSYTLRFLAEARNERRVAAVLRAQHFDRNVTTQLGVVGAEDGRHSALAEKLDEAIAAGEYLSYLGQGLVVPLQIRGQPAKVQLRSSPDRKRRNSPPMSGRSSASSTEA